MPNDDSLEVELLRLEQAARIAQPLIDQAMAQQPYFNILSYSRASRIKSIPRMASKVRHIRSTDDATFQPSMLPDVLGFRIVTYFQAGIPEALEMLLALGEHDTRAGVSPFVKGDIRRITLHTSRPEMDPLSIAHRVEEIAKTHQQKVEQGDHDTLYSSLHVILVINIEVPAIDAGTIIRPLQVEFQLRSVFEEAWGQLSHLLSYGRSRATVDQKTWQLHLGVLKGLIDGCIQYAELIKDQSGFDLRGPENEKESIRAAASPVALFADLPPLTVPIRQKFEAAFNLVDEAQRQTTEEARVGSTFSEAARAFQEVEVTVAHTDNLDPDTKERILYVAQRESAYCYLFANEENSIIKAIELYDAIVHKYNNDAVSRYRYGQALRRHKDKDKAIKMLNESITLLSNDTDQTISKEHWLHSAVYRELGYVYWLMVEDGNDTQIKKEKLHDAIASTRLAVSLSKDDSEMIRSKNNFIYFGWEERNYVEATECEISDLELQTSLDWMLQITDRSHGGGGESDAGKSEFEEWLALDTVARAADYFGDEARAAQAARRVVSILVEKLRNRTTIPPGKRPSSSDIRHHLTADEFDAYLYATTLVGSTP
jgi:ppGpp synthetase/RelA/SpoT-type nucleotidyltranferase